MEIAVLVLLILACVFFGLAAFNIPSKSIAYGWMGLFLWSILTIINALFTNSLSGGGGGLGG